MYCCRTQRMTLTRIGQYSINGCIESSQYMQDLRRESDSIIDSVACIAQRADSLFLRGFIICGQRLNS